MRWLRGAAALRRILFLGAAADEPRDKGNSVSGSTNKLGQQAPLMHVRRRDQEDDSRPQFAISIKVVSRSRRDASVRWCLCLCFYSLFSQAAFADEAWSCALSGQTMDCGFR